MAGKGSFFIMLLIVAFLSLALAVMAGLFFFTSNTDKSEDNSEKKEVKAPKDSELSEFPIDKKALNLKGDGKSEDNAFLQISAVIKYRKEIKSIKDLNTEQKITLNQAGILEIINKYFQNLTLDDIKKDNAIDTAKKKLTKDINEYLVKNEEYKVDIIYTINFSEWLYQ
ncbi:MAG: flagellar basal body-associated FliL family protein [Clostridiales bacterium]